MNVTASPVPHESFRVVDNKTNEAIYKKYSEYKF